MKSSIIACVVCIFFCIADAEAQKIKLTQQNLKPVQVGLSFNPFAGKEAIRVVKDTNVKAVDQPSFVKITDVDFRNGTIEVTVLSRLLPDAPEFARGFIGVAFHISDSNSKFECIYIRPVNGRANNQLQRNHAIQYFSFPDYDFERFRKEAPGEFESYADMGLNEWIKMRIVVKGKQALLFLNDTKQPSLIVNDLKLGADLSGAIGLWVEAGTEGFFSDVKVRKE
jgi:hypothetical protein